MNHSSTQIPFMIAAFIAVMINSVISEPKIDKLENTNTKTQATQNSKAKVVVMLEPVVTKKTQ